MALYDRLTSAAATTAFRWSAAAVAAFLLAAAAISGILFWQTNAILTDQVLAELGAEAQLLRAQNMGGGPVAIAGAVTALSLPDSPRLYFLSGDKGVKIAGNLNRVPPEIEDSKNGGLFHYSARRSGSAEDRLAVAMPVDVGPGLKLLVGRDVEDQRAFADRMKQTFLIGFGVLSLVGLLGGLAVSRMILNRMDAMSAASRSIMEGDLSRRIPIQGNGGELDGLATNLNAMLERIEMLMTGLREVSDNIAHDLKTPLNRLRNSAEDALRDQRGGDAYREGLERTIEKADDLIKTFNALLLIARLESGSFQESVETFDAGALVDDVAELYMPAAEEAGFALAVETVRGLRISANRQLVGQAIANLIDNAIKYSRGQSAGRAITVKASREGGNIGISVADRGPGIPLEDRTRVLKRFVRLEKSRTAPGTGLGLSLVAAVARLHHGSVRLEDNEPGLRVTLLLAALRTSTAEAAAEGHGGEDLIAAQ